MMRIIVLLAFAFAMTSSSYSQTLSDNGDFLQNIQNLPEVLVNVIGSKETELSEQAKSGLVAIAKLESAMTSAIHSVNYHEQLDSWLIKYLTPSEAAQVRNGMKSNFKKNN